MKKRVLISTIALAFTMSFLAGCNKEPEPTLEGIRVFEKPVVTEYAYEHQGDVSLDGILVGAVYSNQTIKIVTDYTHSSLRPTTAQKTAGSFTVTLTYKEKTADIKYTFREPVEPTPEPAVVSKIVVLTNPTTTEYSYETSSVSLAGLVIGAIYSDDTIKVVNNYTHSTLTPTTAQKNSGSFTVTITYEGETATVNFTFLKQSKKYEEVWQNDNYTFEMYNTDDQLMWTIKSNEKGLDYKGYKFWYYGGHALTVYEEQEGECYAYRDDIIGTYYNCISVDTAKAVYGLKDASNGSKFKQISGTNYYISMPGESGYDDLARRILLQLVGSNNVEEYYSQYQNICILFTISNNQVTGVLATDRTEIITSGSYSYFGSFVIKDFGKTELGFTPKIILNGRHQEPENENGD